MILSNINWKREWAVKSDKEGKRDIIIVLDIVSHANGYAYGQDKSIH